MSTQQQLVPLGPAQAVPCTRRPLDRYYTAPWQIAALLRAFPELRGEVLADPCCGDGRMAQQLLRAGRFHTAYLNDLDPAAPAKRHRDGADPDLWDGLRPHFEVSNYPFSAAGELVWASLQRARVGVAALLRCTFGEPAGGSPRAPRAGRRWLTRRPPDGLVMMPRYSYTGDGKSDSAPHWWFVWGVPARIVVVEAAELDQLALPGAAP